MRILHGTWIPRTDNEFIQVGGFYLWVETASPEKSKKNQTENYHPGQLTKDELSTFLVKELGIPDPYHSISQKISTQYFILPSANHGPLPSLELTRYLEEDPPDASEWQAWAIDCYQGTSIIKLLNDLHFLCLYNASDIQFG